MTEPTSARSKGSTDLAPLAPFEQIRDEYAAIGPDDDLARFGEIQERLRGALADAGWSWPEDECWLPMRCPGRGYCTQFLEGSQSEPCGWWPKGTELTRRDAP